MAWSDRSAEPTHAKGGAGMAPRRPVPPGRSGRSAGGGRAATRAATPRGGPTRSGPSVPVRRPAQPRRPAARTTASGEARPPRAPRPRAGAPARTPRRLPLARPVTMMSGVLVILALLIAPYVRPYLAQRSQVAEGKEDLVRLQQEVNALQAQRDRWNDPDYVKAQARSRLHMVMPGEVGYVNLEPGRRTTARTDPRSAAAAVPPGSNQAWYGTLWQSVRSAGAPTPPVPAPTPVTP